MRLRYLLSTQRIFQNTKKIEFIFFYFVFDTRKIIEKKNKKFIIYSQKYPFLEISNNNKKSIFYRHNLN